MDSCPEIVVAGGSSRTYTFELTNAGTEPLVAILVFLAPLSDLVRRLP